MEDYVAEAMEKGCTSARFISGKDLVVDTRTYLKCRWGCPSYGNTRCPQDALKPWEAEEMLHRYDTVLLIHGHDARLLSRTALELERRAFLDGHYFAFALCGCAQCDECLVQKGKSCPTPHKIRPNEHFLGVNVYETVRRLGLHIHVLQNRQEEPDRYAFVLIE